MKKRFLFVLSIIFILSMCFGTISVSADENVDRSALESLIAEAREMEQGDYAAASTKWISFQITLENAERICGDETSTQDDIDSIVSTLQSRINDLGPKKETEKETSSSAAVEEIKAFLEEVKSMKMSDYSVGDYEWNNLQNQIMVTESAIAGGNEAVIISEANVLYSIVESIKAKPNTGDSDEKIDVYPIQTQESHIKIEDIDDENVILIEQKEEKVMPKSTAPFSKGGFIYLGCGSTVAASALVVVGVIGAALAFKKKED